VVSKTKEFKKSIVAAHSFFMGSVNFLVISYPKGWQIHAGDFPPEVDRYTVKMGYAWVTVGNVKHYFSSNDGKFVGFEVRVNKKIKKNKLRFLEVYDKGEVNVNGHEAEYVVGKFERGKLFKEQFNALIIRYYCDFTERYIELYYYSKDIKALYREFLGAVVDSTCH